MNARASEVINDKAIAARELESAKRKRSKKRKGRVNESVIRP